MPNQEKDREQAYRSRINMNEAHEVGFWLNELGVSEQKLRAAISVAGNSAKAVREHLQRRPYMERMQSSGDQSPEQPSS